MRAPVRLHLQILTNTHTHTQNLMRSGVIYAISTVRPISRLHRSRTENRVPSSNCALRVSALAVASRMIYSYETPERAVAFDDSGCGYLDSGRDMCTSELQTGGATSCLQLKSEPMGPSSPESTSELLLNGGPDDCAGCGRLIQVRTWVSGRHMRLCLTNQYVCV